MLITAIWNIVTGGAEALGRIVANEAEAHYAAKLLSKEVNFQVIEFNIILNIYYFDIII